MISNFHDCYKLARYQRYACFFVLKCYITSNTGIKFTRSIRRMEVGSFIIFDDCDIIESDFLFEVSKGNYDLSNLLLNIPGS